MEGRRIPCVEVVVDCGRRRGRNGGYISSARRQDDALGRWWETVPPLGLILRLALGSDDGVERFYGVKPGRYLDQDACETHVVLWIRLGRRGEVDVCPMTEPDTRTLVCAKGDWSRNDLWRLDCNILEEGQDVVEIVCDGGQRLGSGQICLTFIFRLFLLCLHAAFAVFVLFVVFPTVGFYFLCPLRDGARENIQELARVRLLVEDCGFRKEWREEDGVARRLVPLLLYLREVASGGAKENFRDRETDLVAVRGKSDVHLDGNNRR